MDKQDQTNEYFEKDGKKIKRQRCEIYTRIMWYLRPISQSNIWKKSEIYSRKYFKEWCKCNRDFINKRGNETIESRES